MQCHGEIVFKAPSWLADKIHSFDKFPTYLLSRSCLSKTLIFQEAWCGLHAGKIDKQLWSISSQHPDQFSY